MFTSLHFAKKRKEKGHELWPPREKVSWCFEGNGSGTVPSQVETSAKNSFQTGVRTLFFKRTKFVLAPRNTTQRTTKRSVEKRCEDGPSTSTCHLNGCNREDGEINVWRNGTIGLLFCPAINSGAVEWSGVYRENTCSLRWDDEAMHGCVQEHKSKVISMIVVEWMLSGHWSTEWTVNHPGAPPRAAAACPSK